MKFTDDQIESSARSGFLRLDLRDLLRLLWIGIPYLLFFVGATFAVILVIVLEVGTGRLASLSDLFLMVCIGSLATALAVSVAKLFSLRLTRITTAMNAAEARENITKFSKHYRWKAENNRKNLIILRTRQTRRTPRARSERVTILLIDNQILVASMCDPEGNFALASLFNRSANVGQIREILSGTRRLSETSAIPRKSRSRRKRSVVIG